MSYYCSLCEEEINQGSNAVFYDIDGVDYLVHTDDSIRQCESELLDEVGVLDGDLDRQEVEVGEDY